MNPINAFDDEEPFVREECGDTMYDEETLNALTAVVEQRPLLEATREKGQQTEETR